MHISPENVSVEHAIFWLGKVIHISSVRAVSLSCHFCTSSPPVIATNLLLFTSSRFLHPGQRALVSLHHNPPLDRRRPRSNHFPRLLVFNTQCIIKQIPHPDRKKIEQLIRLELSQFIAKLKRLPTMDKSRRGRKSMAGQSEGLSLRLSRSGRTVGISGGVLAYLHMIFPVLPAHLLRDFVKQWVLSGMEGQCQMGDGQCEACIHHHLISSLGSRRAPGLYELPNKSPRVGPFTDLLFLFANA